MMRVYYCSGYGRNLRKRQKGRVYRVNDAAEWYARFCYQMFLLRARYEFGNCIIVPDFQEPSELIT